MGPAEFCPSKHLGFCKIADKCYARKPERYSKQCLSYRYRQYNYWMSETANGIAAQFSLLLRRMKAEIRYLRFNESGDFFGQDCVRKLSLLAEYLQKEHGIITYGYSARKDLDFSGVHFLVKGSEHENGNNGKTVVLKKFEIKEYVSTLSTSDKKSWKICSGSCKTCNMCMKPNNYNIIFPQH